MWAGLDVGDVLRNFWPQLPACIALLIAGVRSRSQPTNVPLATTVAILLPLMVLAYWLIHDFINFGDFLGCLVSCSLFLGTIAGALWFTAKRGMVPVVRLSAGLFAGALTTATLPLTWIYIACYIGGDCL